jgi:DNA invertase Pin-like site-specific DNA recombinase
MQKSNTYSAGLYLRLSKDDEQQGESVSIGTQRSILVDYCKANQFNIFNIYIDDGYSGLNFDRPGFRALLEDVERGVVNLVITKDLSRLGRDYIMTGYYSEMFFQTKGVRYIAIADDFDSEKGGNEIAPFKNILNDMYARDISKKIRNAKHQRAKQGLFISGQTPYGYQKDPRNRNQLIIDPEAAAVVRIIFSLAERGMGSMAIAAELKARRIVTPSVYKYQRGDERFARYPALKNGDHCAWCATTISQILKNPVYTGTLISLKTEVTNYKTKRQNPVPPDRQIVTPNAHEAIIENTQFERVQAVRADNKCTANEHRFNLFRGKLFCECCGHPLQISRKQLKEREADIYLCMYHYSHPEVCPKTHRIYHDMLYPYVLKQVQSFAKSMKRKKVNSKISEYGNIEELTPEALDAVIERIEIGHVKYKSKPGSVIQIRWKLI